MTKREAALLDYEQRHPTHSRTKEAEIREQFGVSPARFYQIRNRILRTPDGVASYPALARAVRSAPTGLRAMFDYAR